MDRSGVIDTATLRRLAKILAMTGADHDGEVLAAARRASHILSRLNMDYYDVLCGQGQTEGQAAELERLRQALAAERRRAEVLEESLQQADAQPADQAPKPFVRSLEHLRLYLMNHIALKRHERALLERIEYPKPKSKEAHIIRICAQRYGVVLS